MIRLEQSGSFQNIERFLNKAKQGTIFQSLEKYGSLGVNALSNATPKDSGLAADSWYYEIVQGKGFFQIIWKNRNIENGFPVAVMIQYGHGTGTGGYVEGIDYINPAMRPIFEQIVNELWKAVTA